MFVSIDFGGSTIDVVFWRKDANFEISEIRSFERENLFSGKSENFEKIFEVLDLSLEGVKKIFVTGGKSKFLPETFAHIPIVKISEIHAIGQGGYFLLHHDPILEKYRQEPKFLVVSMGTGTCMVTLKQPQGILEKVVHAGGTGVGGGTFLGLAKALLHETDIRTLKKLFTTGDKNRVDLSVQEIIGSGIGKVPSEATAAHLAKLFHPAHQREINFSRSDVAAGIVNLIGQTIGLIAIFAAQASKASAILLTGKLTTIEKIIDIMVEIAHMYNIPMIVPNHAQYVSALGAWDSRLFLS